MPRRSPKPAPVPSRPAARTAFVIGVLAVATIAVATFVVLRMSGSAQPVPWTRFGTPDVHSLAFVDGDPQRVLFGRHGGLEASSDGGATWSQLPVRNDAMSTSVAKDSSIVIAGHEVFVGSRDGGQTWAPIESDLPSLDIHGFTRDPADPARMWAYLATGGLWESLDFGARWTQVRADNVVFPTAVVDGTTRLLGVDARGLVTSTDGGRTWTSLSMPPTYPMTGLAASADGGIVYAGASDGLFRSSDGGRSWTRTGYTGSVFAITTSPDGRTVAVVSRETEFFRSADGGATWPGPPAAGAAGGWGRS